MKGAVHGVDRTAVMTPKPKEPGTLSALGSMRYTPWGRRKSKRPSMLTPATATTRPTTGGNHTVWKRLLMASKPETNATAPPSASQNATMPAPMAAPSTTSREEPPAALLRPMILMGTSGSTHGVRLRSRPPSAAMSSNAARPMAPVGRNVKDQPKTLMYAGTLCAAGTVKPPRVKPANRSGSLTSVDTGVPAATTWRGTVTSTPTGG
jgi:hypothetical protein